jgi:hypothetical protein
LEGIISSQGACTLLADRLDCQLGALTVAAVAQVIMTVSAPLPIDVALVAAVRQRELDANNSDNAATVALKIVSEAQGGGSVAGGSTDGGTTPGELKASGTKTSGCNAQSDDSVAAYWFMLLLAMRLLRRKAVG